MDLMDEEKFFKAVLNDKKIRVNLLDFLENNDEEENKPVNILEHHDVKKDSKTGVNIGCPTLESNGCQILIEKKDQIFAINNKYIKDIEIITGIIGNYERYNSSNMAGLGDYFDKDAGIDEDLRKMVTQSDLGLIHNFENGFIIKKKMDYVSRKPLKKSYTLVSSEMFGTGNLSISLLLGLKYTDEDTGIIYDSIAKIYPINFLNIVDHNKDYQKIFNGEKRRERFHRFFNFMFMREGLIGCWIKKYLLDTNVSPTFACIYDSYKIKGLMIDKDKFAKAVTLNKEKFNKKWIRDIDNKDIENYWEQKISTTHFGYIEMEKMDYTLYDFMQNDRGIFDLDIIFEILYSKLVLMFYGNVYMLDDHANNIMLQKTDIIRHYQITRRKTTYNFYIRYPYLVKYIDFERFGEVSDRNIFIHPTDVFMRYFDAYYMKFFSQPELPIAKYIFTELKNPRQATVNNFCELMVRCLPERFTNPDYYIGRNIQKYSINLDIREFEHSISNNFLSELVQNFDPSTMIKSNDTKLIDVPFKLQIDDHLNGGFYDKKYMKYMKKNFY